MKLKRKGWLWVLTWPFAHNNWTSVGDTIYCPKDRITTKRIVAHAKVHLGQQKRVGLLKFLALYFFALPLFVNPWRKKWEREAFLGGSGYQEHAVERILSGWRYGWLR